MKTNLCTCGNTKKVESTRCRDCYQASRALTPEVKECTACHQTKPWSDFRLRHGRTKDGTARPRPSCKACEAAAYKKYYEDADAQERSAKHRAWRLANPRTAMVIKLRTLARGYGLDPDVIEKHFNEHDGLCDVCTQPQSNGRTRLYIDHCHTTGKFRGLLCSNCNTGLGMFKDDPNILAAAIQYLLTSK